VDPFDSPLTRRQALKYGAATGLVVMLARVPTMAMAATGDDAEPHLRRASYVQLIGQAFAVAGSTLVLTDVGDLDHLPGRDDAFRLEFTGAPGAVEAGTAQFSKQALGSFELFVAPVCEITGGVQRYEVVIDRSVPLPRHPPEPARREEPAPAETPAAASTAPAAAAPAAVTRAPAHKSAKVVKRRAVKKKQPKRHRKLRLRKPLKRKRR
jgi:hypothetical protein